MSTHEDFSRAAAAGGSNRSFGLVFAAVFGIIAAWPLMEGGGVRWWAAGVCGGFAVIAVLRPGILTPLNWVWTKFGLLLHRVTNPLLLGIIFFVAITPMALIVRALGNDLLRLKRQHDAATYWIPRTPPGPAPETMKQQF